MAHYGSNVEYGLHCLLLLASRPADRPASARDLAEFQGVSPSLVAKLFTRLKDAGLVEAVEGIGGGFRLARPAEAITVHDVVQALEGRKPLFDCKGIRANCVLFDGTAPAWATRGLCEIHQVMLQAEARMADALRQHTLASLARAVAGKTPAAIRAQGAAWFGRRLAARGHGGDANGSTS